MVGDRENEEGIEFAKGHGLNVADGGRIFTKDNAIWIEAGAMLFAERLEKGAKVA